MKLNRNQPKYILFVLSIAMAPFFGCGDRGLEDQQSLLQYEDKPAERCDETCTECGVPPSQWGETRKSEIASHTQLLASGGSGGSGSSSGNIAGSDEDNKWLDDCYQYGKARTAIGYWGVKCPLSGEHFNAILAACTPPNQTGTIDRLKCILEKIAFYRADYPEAVCRHWSVCFEQLAIAGIPADVNRRAGECDKEGGPGKTGHAWVDFEDPETGETIVVDAQNGLAHFQ